MVCVVYIHTYVPPLSNMEIYENFCVVFGLGWTLVRERRLFVETLTYQMCPGESDGLRSLLDNEIAQQVLSISEYLSHCYLVILTTLHWFFSFCGIYHVMYYTTITMILSGPTMLTLTCICLISIEKIFLQLAILKRLIVNFII